jgi:hypothetical protein
MRAGGEVARGRLGFLSGQLHVASLKEETGTRQRLVGRVTSGPRWLPCAEVPPPGAEMVVVEEARRDQR